MSEGFRETNPHRLDKLQILVQRFIGGTVKTIEETSGLANHEARLDLAEMKALCLRINHELALSSASPTLLEEISSTMMEILACCAELKLGIISKEGRDSQCLH